MRPLFMYFPIFSGLSTYNISGPDTFTARQPPQCSPKGLTAPLVLLHVVLEWRRVALTQAVDVQDGHQVVQLVVRGEGHRLPHGAFGELAITQQAEHPVAAERGEGRKKEMYPFFFFF